MKSFVPIAVIAAFVVGVAARTVYELPPEFLWWLLGLALVMGVVWRRNRRAISAPVLFVFGLSLAAFVAGVVRTDIASWQFVDSSLETSVGKEIRLEGVVVREPDYRARTVHLYVETDDDLVLVTADRLQGVLYGDLVKVSGKLKEPESFTTELGRTFNYPGYLLARGVQYQISFAEVSVADRNLGNPIIAALLSAKQHFIEKLDTVITEPAVGLGKGLLLGIKSALGEEIETNFRRSGLTHIVVLSGYNVMLVVAFILFCLSFVLGLRGRVVFGLLGIVAFALIVGLSATVVRASIMAGLVLLAQLYGRRYDVVRALFVAGLMMVLINPYIVLYDIGFQLSFVATLGLVLLLPQFESTVVTETRKLHLKEFFFATLATQIAVLPLLWYHIGEISIVAVLVNVMVLPVVPLAMFGTFLAGLAGFFSQIVALGFGLLAWVPLQFILLVSQYAAALPFATVLLPEISALTVGLMYTAMLLGWWYWQKEHKETSRLAGWIIEEEESGAPGGAPLKKDNSKNDLPIFFR
tara:strand:- start:3360 stop:4934 length:1575 start_codon:yes stop_codon:yes gene_type:complete